MRKIKKLIFKFKNIIITLSQYLLRKINLLHNVKLNDEDIIIKFI